MSVPPPAPSARTEGFLIRVGDGGQGFWCRPGERVLLAMERQGRCDIPVGCRGGGCGICRVQVLEGTYRTGPMSRRHVSSEDALQGYALACRLHATDDLVLALRPGLPQAAPSRTQAERTAGEETTHGHD